MGFENFVGPVTSREMAMTLEESGASIVAVMPDPLPRFDPDASVDLHVAQDVREGLQSARLCLLLDGRSAGARLRDLIGRLQPEYVALDSRHSEAGRFLPILRLMQTKVLLFGPALDYDEDPSWVEERLQVLTSEWNPAAIMCTLLPGMKSPVHWLCSESGKHEEDVILSDIKDLLARFPVFVNMEMSESEIGWACGHFTSARGFAFFVGEPVNDGGSPVLSDVAKAAVLLQYASRVSR